MFGVRHGIMVTITRPWYTFDVLYYSPFAVQGTTSPGEVRRFKQTSLVADGEDGEGGGSGAADAPMAYDPALPVSELPAWMSQEDLEKTRPLTSCVQQFIAGGGSLVAVTPPDGSMRFAIHSTDYVFPVCASGATLSAALWELLLDQLVREDAIGGDFFAGQVALPHATDGVDAPHAGFESDTVATGASPDDDDEYFEAFGHEMVREEMAWR